MTAEQRKAMETVCDFIKKAGTYYIASAEGDQPRVRPFGVIHIFEDKLYIQTGRRKKCYKQALYSDGPQKKVLQAVCRSEGGALLYAWR